MKRGHLKHSFNVHFSFSTVCHQLGNDLSKMITKNGFTSLIRKLRTVTMKFVMVLVLLQVIMKMICTTVERKREKKLKNC